MKFHFKTQQGHKHYTNEESAKIIGETREKYQEELFGAIERGEYPKWTLKIQVMPEADAEKTPYNPFDLTKVWPHADYPLIEVGELELNKNPENYWQYIENAAIRLLMLFLVLVFLRTRFYKHVYFLMQMHIDID